ncbi:MAG TPA: glycosyltransferase [Bryobacteraceae bacterium]
MPDLPLSVWIAAGGSVIFLIFFLAAWQSYRSLPVIRALPESVDRKNTEPDCMVVIPARNEAGVIANAVASLPPDCVIVVDDASDDGTADVATKAGAGVISAPPLPKRGFGKPNACAAGARLLTSRWILFTDADTSFEPGFLASAIAAAEAKGLSLLSIQLDPDYGSLAEHVLIPYARALVFCGSNPRTHANALFTGNCLLVQREPYNFLGTHIAVVTQLAEDVKLTALAERHRLKLGIARAPGLGRRRYYEGFRGIYRGIERQAFRFMVVSWLIGVLILLAALCAALWLPLAAWLAWDRQWAAVAILALLPVVTLRPWYRNWLTALSAPLAIYWMLPVLARGLLSAVFGKPIVWKGRTVRAVS